MKFFRDAAESSSIKIQRDIQRAGRGAVVASGSLTVRKFTQTAPLDSITNPHVSTHYSKIAVGIDGPWHSDEDLSSVCWGDSDGLPG